MKVVQKVSLATKAEALKEVCVNKVNVSFVTKHFSKAPAVTQLSKEAALAC